MGVSYRGERMMGNMPFSLFKWPQRNRGKNENRKRHQVFENK